ncbi:MAG: hypothetical protein WAZ14_03195 [Patescibacteria group bacterium]
MELTDKEMFVLMCTKGVDPAKAWKRYQYWRKVFARMPQREMAEGAAEDDEPIMVPCDWPTYVARRPVTAAEAGELIDFLAKSGKVALSKVPLYSAECSDSLPYLSEVGIAREDFKAIVKQTFGAAGFERRPGLESIVDVREMPGWDYFYEHTEPGRSIRRCFDGLDRAREKLNELLGYEALEDGYVPLFDFHSGLAEQMLGEDISPAFGGDDICGLLVWPLPVLLAQEPELGEKLGRLVRTCTRVQIKWENGAWLVYGLPD